MLLSFLRNQRPEEVRNRAGSVSDPFCRIWSDYRIWSKSKIVAARLLPISSYDRLSPLMDIRKSIQ
jgi:hypothetical protein